MIHKYLYPILHTKVYSKYTKINVSPLNIPKDVSKLI